MKAETKRCVTNVYQAVSLRIAFAEKTHCFIKVGIISRDHAIWNETM